MSAIARYGLCWDWGVDGIDRVEVTEGPEGLRLTGRRGEVTYRVETDASGATTCARVASRSGTTSRDLVFTRDAGGWHDSEGSRLPGSDNALDVDIGCTAATNTLPIRRLGLGVGETAEIDVVLFPVPELEPRVVRQRYSRHTGGYLYENAESGFSARLAVDSDGWVTEYPGLCKRMEDRL